MICLEKHQIVLALLLLFSVLIYFLPWFIVKVSFNDEAYTEIIYGYYYVVPIVTPYNVPVGILCVIGSVLSAVSFEQTKKFWLFNVTGGILILTGIISSFIYTFNAISSKIPFGSTSWSVNVWAEYGAGLMLLFGSLIIIVGAFKKLRGAMRGLYVEMKPLVKIGVCGLGIVCLIIGIALIALSIYSLAGGTGITFTINERVVTAQEGGQIFSIIGVIMFLVGILFTYLGFKKMK